MSFTKKNKARTRKARMRRPIRNKTIFAMRSKTTSYRPKKRKGGSGTGPLLLTNGKTPYGPIPPVKFDEESLKTLEKALKEEQNKVFEALKLQQQILGTSEIPKEFATVVDNTKMMALLNKGFNENDISMKETIVECIDLFKEKLMNILDSYQNINKLIENGTDIKDIKQKIDFLLLAIESNTNQQEMIATIIRGLFENIKKNEGEKIWIDSTLSDVKEWSTGIHKDIEKQKGIFQEHKAKYEGVNNSGHNVLNAPGLLEKITTESTVDDLNRDIEAFITMVAYEGTGTTKTHKGITKQEDLDSCKKIIRVMMEKIKKDKPDLSLDVPQDKGVISLDELVGKKQEIKSLTDTFMGLADADKTPQKTFEFLNSMYGLITK